LSVGTKIKIVSTVHSPYPYYFKKNLYSFIKRNLEIITINIFNSTVITVSEAVKDCLVKHTRINKKIVVILGGTVVSATIKKGINNKNIVNISKKYFTKNIILSIGRLSDEKGYDCLLKAFKLVACNRNDCSLIIIGDGDLLHILKNMTVKLKIDKYTHFVGFKKNIYEYLAVCTVYVCSSKYEGLGLSILEAMAMGVPVVATSVGGIPEIIENKISGLLVEPDNPGSLANCILTFLEDKSYRIKIGNEGKKRVIKQFDIKRVVETTENLYYDVFSL
jgi:glycosyltransferase involved in cell wall biosynthesis